MSGSENEMSMEMAQDRVHWRDLVLAMLKFRVPLLEC
jgi:hypothetical protein